MALSLATRVLDGTGWPRGVFKHQVPDNFICTRKYCGNTLREPIQLRCGHRVCKDCLDLILAMDSEERICNSCIIEYQDELTQQAAGSPDSINELPQLEADARPWSVKLPHAVIISEEWTEDEAAATDVGGMDAVCPYGCGETYFEERPLLIKTLEKHMECCHQRLIPCDKCQASVKHSDLQTHLTDDCQFRPVDCSYGCGTGGLLAKDLARHQAWCDKKPPPCWLCGEPYEGSLDSHFRQECRASKCPLCCTDMRAGELIYDHFHDVSNWVTHHIALCNQMMAQKQLQVTNSANIQQLQSQTQCDTKWCELLRAGFTPESGRTMYALRQLFYVSSGDIVKYTIGQLEWPQPQCMEGLSRVMWKLGRVYDLQNVDWRYSEQFRINPGGQMMCLGLNFQGHRHAKGSNVSICILRMKGEDENDNLVGQMDYRVTLRIKNLQMRDDDDISKSYSQISLPTPTGRQVTAYGDVMYAPCKDLQLPNDFILDGMMVIEAIVRGGNRIVQSST